MVLENSVIFGSVNANRKHWEKAKEALLKADRKWLSRLISRKRAARQLAGSAEAASGRHKGCH